MMESKKYNIIFLALLLLACVKENFTVILGESITASAEIPEDSEDLEFIWELTSVPDKSEIKKSDIQFGDDSTLINFTPDVPGIYSLEVSIFLYQDEISTESFSYDVVETEIADVNTQEFEEKTYLNEGESTAVSELLVENDDSKWYDSESVADVLENIKEIPVERILKEEMVKEENISPPKPPASQPKIKVKKKITIKDRGSSIPYDKDRFTIQVGSKKVLADAKKFAAKLIDAGYDAYIQKAVFKETNEVWYRIRVGSYAKRQTASAVAKSLSETQQENAWVDFVRYEY